MYYFKNMVNIFDYLEDKIAACGTQQEVYCLSKIHISIYDYALGLLSDVYRNVEICDGSATNFEILFDADSQEVTFGQVCTFIAPDKNDKIQQYQAKGNGYIYRGSTKLSTNDMSEQVWAISTDIEYILSKIKDMILPLMKDIIKEPIYI